MHNGVGRGQAQPPLGWPLLLGYRHVGKSRCGPAFQAQPTAFRGHLSCCRPQWQICCRQMQSQNNCFSHLLAVLSLLCIVWHTFCCVEIAARRRVRLPSGVSFLCGKFCVGLFLGLQDSCPFLSSKRALRTPDEPDVRRNNGLMCMHAAHLRQFGRSCKPRRQRRFETIRLHDSRS